MKKEEDLTMAPQPIRYRVIQFIAGLIRSNWFAGVCCLAFLCIVLLINSPLGASYNQAQSLKELLTWYDTSRCKECHEEIYAQWEKSHHARSIMDIFMDGYLKKGFLAVKNPNEATRKNFPCFKCHFPQLEHASDKVATEIVYPNDIQIWKITHNGVDTH
ncbi:MAG: multiheme c-type cytochrome, partial [Candidatus Desulfacyla sp.]